MLPGFRLVNSDVLDKELVLTGDAAAFSRLPGVRRGRPAEGPAEVTVRTRGAGPSVSTKPRSCGPRVSTRRGTPPASPTSRPTGHRDCSMSPKAGSAPC